MTSAKLRILEAFVVPEQNEANRRRHSTNPERRKQEGPRGFQKTPRASKRVFPKDNMIIRPSRWLAVAACGRQKGVFLRQLGHPTLKRVNVLTRKPACLQDRSFASKAGWDPLLKRLLDDFGPLQKTARESDSIHLVATDASQTQRIS